MNYLKIELKTGVNAYALREYFPYTDKPFFKSLDEILVNEDLQINLGHMFAQLYKDELTFINEDISKHLYIVPIPHNSKKFNQINTILCDKISKILNINVINDYFESIKIPYVDIRDEFTKEEALLKFEINRRYQNIPVILFDVCCSTGIIFSNVTNSNFYNDKNILLTYGVRFNASELDNTHIKKINIIEFSLENIKQDYAGYIFKIYGLFGDKNVEVKFNSDFTILIGENGFGKTTAHKIALLALQYLKRRISVDCYIVKYMDSNSFYCNDIEKKFSPLSMFNFDKIEIYLNDYTDPSHQFEYKISNLITTIHYKDVVISKQLLNNKITNVNCSKFITTITEREYFEIVRKMLLNDRTIEIDYKNLMIKYNLVLDFNDIDKRIRNYILSFAPNIKLDYIEMTNDNRCLNSKLKAKKFIYLNCAKSRKLQSKPFRERINLELYEQLEKMSYPKVLTEKDEAILDKHSEYDTAEENERYILEEEDKIRNIKEQEDPFYFDYEDPDDYNPYEDDNSFDSWEYYSDENDDYVPHKEKRDAFVLTSQKYLDNRIKYYFKESLNLLDNLKKDFYNFYYLEDVKDIQYIVEKSQDYNEEEIQLYKILNDSFMLGKNFSIKTNFYSILEQIFLFDGVDSEKIEFFSNFFFSKKIINYASKTIKSKYNTIINLNLIFDEDMKKKIEKIFVKMITQADDILPIGIYDVLNDQQYKKLSSIVTRIRSKGFQFYNDYLVVIGLVLLIKSYKNDFIKTKHKLLEKLINKYFINKNVTLYANNIVIKDYKNDFIPIEYLSTGEKNLIMLFSFCLSKNNSFIILDEPDLSMSVEWQSKILVDLLKYTNNQYSVITQSPLVVQKNNLSLFVKRMDLES